jgi:hypothetical protein
MEPDQNNLPGKRSLGRDLWEFFCALWPSTSGYITGGSVAAIMTILSVLGVVIPHYVIWLLISLAFFASAFLAYRRQRMKAEILKLNLQWPMFFISLGVCLISIILLIKFEFVSPLVKRLIQPDFSAEVWNSSLSDELGPNPKIHFFTIEMTIYNNGAQSVVRNWKLKVNGPDKQDIYPPALVFGDQWQTNWNSDGTFTLRENKDSFTGQVGNNPIVRGGKQAGFIVFQISDTSRAYLESSATKYTLSFWDMNGKEYDLPPASFPPPKK